MSQRDKPQLALNNITAGVREREDANRTREAGPLDEIQGAVANMLKLSRQGAVGFIDWLDELPSPTSECDRNIDLFPLSGLPLPLAKRFHRVLIQCRSSRRFDHCDFAHRTRPYIKRDSEEAASCTWRDHLASDLPCSQFIRI